MSPYIKVRLIGHVQMFNAVKSWFLVQNYFPDNFLQPNYTNMYFTKISTEISYISQFTRSIYSTFFLTFLNRNYFPLNLVWLINATYFLVQFSCLLNAASWFCIFGSASDGYIAISFLSIVVHGKRSEVLNFILINAKGESY